MMIHASEQIDDDIAEVRRAHAFDGADAPYQPEFLTVARAAERLADEVERLRDALTAPLLELAEQWRAVGARCREGDDAVMAAMFEQHADLICELVRSAKI
jgi:hypothetical protein